jgi:hypothetical protein
MNREVHVRFWESPEVKVLRATRQIRPWCSIGVGGGLSPDSCRSRRMPTTAESGQKQKSQQTHTSVAAWFAAVRSALKASVGHTTSAIAQSLLFVLKKDEQK